MAEVVEGKKAPQFTLPASTGQRISLKDYRGKSHVVLYFYPRDMTPGCTKEACSFRDLGKEFAAAGAVILGVSTDDLSSHEKFTKAHHLTFPLLSDNDAKVSTKYGVYKEKNMYGRKVMGIERTTFVIDREGVVRRIWRKVKVERHADEVLDFVRNL
ncbi:MAG: thioredoxin-dependent thiol peroxidase [Armatimonadota bacterium]